MDVAGGKNENGTNVQIWDCDDTNPNQQLVLNNKLIKWGNNNKCLDVAGGRNENGTNVQIGIVIIIIQINNFPKLILIQFM